jgi:hypothetical protein
MKAFIDFFSETDEKKGFVYGKDIRIKLRKAISEYEWA